MKSILKSILFCLLFCSSINAEEIYGHIYDNVGRTLPYASIYIQSSPSTGTVSNNTGLFVLKMEHFSPKDTLVVSFVGYATKHIPLSQIRPTEKQSITLEEDMIMLSEATVFAKPIKNSRKAMVEILKHVKKQMEMDFPDDKNREYKIMSDYAIYNSDSIIATLDKAFGTIIEYPNMGYDGKDSIYFILDRSESYIDPDIQKTLDGFEESEFINEKNKKMIRDVDHKSLPHQMLWGKDIKAFFDDFSDEKVKRWNISERDANTSILSYREKKNYLGIVRYELKLNFIIDKHSYSINRLSQELHVKVYLPLSYKLSKDELDILNVVALTGEKVDKFRIKRGRAHIIRDVKYAYKGKEKHPTEKTALFDMQFQNVKKAEYKWISATKIQVIE